MRQAAGELEGKGVGGPGCGAVGNVYRVDVGVLSDGPQ